MSEESFSDKGIPFSALRYLKAMPATSWSQLNEIHRLVVQRRGNATY
jgi:hypothetical protein